MTKTTLQLLAALAVAGVAAPACADDWHERSGQGRWWHEDWKDEFRDGPCRVKVEAKGGEYKREVKCRDGIGARWQGEWKREFRDGPCRVKLEAKRDEYKEEVKCAHDD